MTQRHHLRTVEIRTITAGCDECGASSPASGHDTLIGWGWRLRLECDLCPDCARAATERSLRAEENAVRARHLAALQDDDTPLYVHGRIFIGAAVLYARGDINAEIGCALSHGRRGAR